jgi:hypothetical protein
MAGGEGVADKQRFHRRDVYRDAPGAVTRDVNDLGLPGERE